MMNFARVVKKAIPSQPPCSIHKDTGIFYFGNFRMEVVLGIPD
jgi:hypothetical protein